MWEERLEGKEARIKAIAKVGNLLCCSGHTYAASHGYEPGDGQLGRIAE
jgi:hypothetical protein